MAVKLKDIRELALSLPDTTEEPHHHFGSFRVQGKIFVTIAPGGELLHIFLNEQEREQALSMDSEFLDPLLWGGKVVGVRAKLPLARKSTVAALVCKAYEHKAAATPRKRAAKRSAQGN